MRIIELRKDFGGFDIEICGLELEPGIIHGLIGPNGCGKTTLAKLIVGSIPAQRRNIDFRRLTPRDITMTSQKPYIMRGSVYNNLVYPLRLRGVSPERAETARWLELCGLDGKAYARGLSSGQRQKLSIARSLIFNPKLVIIDESLSNLDLDSVERFEQEIMRIQQAAPITWLIISHQPAHVRRLCDKVHFMDNGRVLLSGTPGELLENPSRPELLRYLKHDLL